jgi:Epoxide hydrolase N terminus
MTETTAAGSRPAEPGAATEDPSIRRFRVEISDEELVELRRRITATRWPERETVNDDSQGAPLATMQDLARSWAGDDDWRPVEANLNALPQFLTTIDGLDLHFLQVRSPTPRRCR